MSADQVHKTQGRLLLLAALFLGLFALALTLSPAARARNWDVDYRWSHWLGVAVWVIGFGLIHRETRRWLPARDPYLVPIMAVLAGWGLLTIWRLTSYYGTRQTIWLALALGFFTAGLRLPPNLNFLRRYKYLWLSGGLTLTGLTLLLGTNPMGYGPRLWLGCCGFYMQPSEPLKLLLIVFLAAYLADWQSLLVKGGKVQASGDRSQVPGSGSKEKSPGTPYSLSFQAIPRMQILVPTLIMSGIALLLLVVQRDLGTASLFIFIYAVMIYLATGWSVIPVITGLVLAAAGALGYLLFDVVRLRIDAWINPWSDPTGRSFQIVQSLMALANGGVLGRGPGLGSPTLVPVSHSDFIFSAIGEETGLVGMVALVVVLGLLVHRGVLIALHSADTFRRLLAAGSTAFLVGQSVLIIGGNLRLLPLTGVTLPLVSYGGSSLMVSIGIILLLLLLSTQVEDGGKPGSGQRRKIIQASLPPFTIFLLVALTSSALAAGWWAFVRSPDLLTRTDNPRRALDDRFVYRGRLLARRDTILVDTKGVPGEFVRSYSYPALGPVTGYNHPIYGQSGLEASLDPVLRGLEGNDPAMVEWHHLLYGQSPPGQDVRLTLDMALQNLADDLLEVHRGALILLNAETGEILVMASHPGFDPNQLDDSWDLLVEDPQAPLINRVTQGNYPTGELGALQFMQAASNPEIERIALRLPLANTVLPEEATPLDVAFSAASLSNGGVRPAARLALSYQHPDNGWQLFPPLAAPTELLSPEDVESLLSSHQSSISNVPTWEIAATPAEEDLTWFLAGSVPGDSTPLILTLVLETENLPLAEEIGRAVLDAGMNR